MKVHTLLVSVDLLPGYRVPVYAEVIAEDEGHARRLLVESVKSVVIYCWLGAITIPQTSRWFSGLAQEATERYLLSQHPMVRVGLVSPMPSVQLGTPFGAVKPSVMWTGCLYVAFCNRVRALVLNWWDEAREFLKRDYEENHEWRRHEM